VEEAARPERPRLRFGLGDQLDEIADELIDGGVKDW